VIKVKSMYHNRLFKFYLFNFRRGPARYRFQSMYDLCNLAVVNIKDIKNSFKLLAFPETRVFQAPNTGLKVCDFQCYKIN